jgi:hypothetical protein
MRPFIVAVVVLLSIVVAINSVATWDRSRHEDRIRTAAATFQPGQAMLAYRDTDERRFQKARLAVIPPPRIVAFGSSRVMEVSTRMVGVEQGAFYNAGMSGASVEDFIVLWSVLRDTGRIPRVALFSLDNWSFNRSHPQVPWLVWADEVSRLVDNMSGAGHGRVPHAETLLYRWYQTKELVSYSVLRTSLRDLNRVRLGRTPRGAELVQSLANELVDERQVAGRRALLADGSLIYEATFDARPRAEVRADAVDFAVRLKAGLRDFSWDAERAHRLQLLWKDLDAHGVSIRAYLPPYHPEVWELIRRDPKLVEALHDTRVFLEGLAARFGTRLLDLSDPASVSCTEDDFLDGNHARRECMKRIVARALGAGRSTPVAAR